MKLDRLLVRLLPMPLFAAVLLGVAALNLALFTGGLSPTLINPDEGGHYVNALFLGDWIRAGFPSPMAYARDYYAHFPRLSIGHWPPGWYLLEAPIFAIFRPSPLHATVLSAFVAGLPGGLVFWGMQRIGRPWLGLALGVAYVMLPLAVDGGRYILLDQPVALVIGIGAIAWFHAANDPRWWRFLLFAACAAYAPLVKGNGALIALVPAIHIALTGRWALLKRPSLWVAALLTMLVVAPWYWLSFQISAGGFNYAPGPEYAWLALSANVTSIWANLGPAGIALAGFGAWHGLRSDGETKGVAQIAIAVILATLLFQSLVPAALEPRYVTPLLPWLVVLIGSALVPLLRGFWAPAASLAALVPALLALWALPPKPDFNAWTYAASMVEKGGIWMVDGRAGGEGALIAAAAHWDKERKQIWVTRASQWLSTSDFMGRGYTLTTRTPEEARAVLDKLGISGVVSIGERNLYAYPHSKMLFRAVDSPEWGLNRREFTVGEGTGLRAIRLGPTLPPNLEMIEQTGSANLGKMKGALD